MDFFQTPFSVNWVSNICLLYLPRNCFILSTVTDSIYNKTATEKYVQYSPCLRALQPRCVSCVYTMSRCYKPVHLLVLGHLPYICAMHCVTVYCSASWRAVFGQRPSWHPWRRTWAPGLSEGAMGLKGPSLPQLGHVNLHTRALCPWAV